MLSVKLLLKAPPPNNGDVVDTVLVLGTLFANSGTVGLLAVPAKSPAKRTIPLTVVVASGTV